MDKKAEPKSILEKRKEAQKAFEEATNALRRCINIVLKTEEGVNVFKFLYRLFGGENEIVRTDEHRQVDLHQTLILADRHDVYAQIRRHISSDKLKEIERHNWEK